MEAAAGGGMSTIIETHSRVKESSGWREGRPVEDPEKTKRWGFVTAKPSEYLVHVRRGKVLKTSGQGATCFKWPWDAVAIVPTSLQRLTFRADQVTLERVGVEVVGLAVYRIAEPLIAYRVLNFSYAERAQQKLEEALGAMFVGATRRLVANLSVNDCLQKRKSALAEELIREIEPVVRGEGRPEDYTEKGWGLVIDTIEIQEVRVLSDRVFASMQAPYRAQLERSARQAKADTERDIATREADCAREVEEARLASEKAVREKRAELEEARLVGEAEMRDKQREIARAEAESRARDQIAEIERTESLARREIAAHELMTEALAQKNLLRSLEANADAERRRVVAEVELVEARAQAEGELASARAERELAEAKARVLNAENLPKLAAAVGQKFGEVKVTHFGNDNPFGSIAQAIASVVEVARSQA
jgi:hypothetical protein